jgi:hypothetical protein
MSTLHSSSHGITTKSLENDELTKINMTINLKDLDLRQLTTYVMDLGNNSNGYLMQTSKNAYNEGL